MKKLIICLLAVYSTAFGQAIETRNYDFPEKKPTPATLTKEEMTESIIYIKDKRVTEYIYNKDGDLEEYFTMHRRMKLNDSKSVEENNKIYISVAEPSDLLSFKARSISKSGAVKEMLRGEMKEITDNGRRYMTLAIDGLEVGSEVEFFYTSRQYLSYYASQTLQTNAYSRLVEFQLISPENLVFDFKAYNGCAEPKDTVIGKKNIYSASMDRVLPMNEERYATEDANKMRIEYKLYRNRKSGNQPILTFADAGNDYYSRYASFEKSELKDVEKVISKMNIKSLSDLEKLRAIESYVKGNINIDNRADFKDISEVIKKQAGNEFLSTRLTGALLKSAGMKYEIIMSCNRYKKRFDSAFESWNFLSDVMFYVPSVDRYIDPTNLLYRSSLTPLQYLGNNALVIKEISLGDISSAVTSIKKIKEPAVNLSNEKIEIAIQFQNDFKQVTQHSKRMMNGYFATSIRPYYFYSPDEKKKEMIEGLMKSDIDAAKVTNLKVLNYNLNSEDEEKDFTIDADLTYNSLIEKAGNNYLFKVGVVIGPQVELYQKKERQNPVEIDFPHNLDRTIVITVPDGYVAKGLDALKMNIIPDTKENPLGFVSDYTVNGNKIEIKIHEYYNRLSYPLSMYEQFRKVINAAADFNKVSIIFEKKS